MTRIRCRIFTLICAGSFLLPALRVDAGKLPGNHWEVLTIVYPPDRNIIISVGGVDKTLMAKGTCRVKWQKEAATLAIEIKGLPSAAEAGWPGHQYVLWAVDKDKRSVNLGAVPLRGKDVKWTVQSPLRSFGLLITAEQDPKATAPSPNVALESLLPADPAVVLPIYRVDLALGAPPA